MIENIKCDCEKGKWVKTEENDEYWWCQECTSTMPWGHCKKCSTTQELYALQQYLWDRSTVWYCDECDYAFNDGGY